MADTADPNTDRTSADDGQTIMPNPSVEQRKHRS
jgi:hypothetical protein